MSTPFNSKVCENRMNRKRLEVQLAQTQKMESIGTLAGGIAHDFNNILSSVLGYAGLAKMKLEKGDNLRDDLDGILKAGIRARDLVKQILTFSRQTDIQRSPVVMAPLIKEALKFIRASLPATIEIRQNITALTSAVMGDPTQIHQVIMNLCTNAGHAMQAGGGVLEVRLQEVELEGLPQIQNKGLKKGRHLRLSISDTGHGIAPVIMNRIFDPFFTTKKRGEGTGMGLAVVHGIIKDMQGAISVYSELGRGTTFNIFLPVYAGEIVEGTAIPAMPRKGTGRILLVDDEEGIVASTRGILEELGYEVEATTSASEALEIFRAEASGFDLVLSDLTMPHMTGLELAEKIREIRPAIPILLCSGLGVGITEEQMSKAGIREIIKKPMIASELADAVYRSLNPD